jgi:hypothetical protein
MSGSFDSGYKNPGTAAHAAPRGEHVLRIFSYGGGVQSTAALVLAAQRKIDFRTFLFSNVGDDSEHPGTLAYVRHVARPYAAVHGIELKELQRTRRDGSTETLHGRLTRPGSRSLPIPVRMSNGAPGTRSCTADFKIKVIGRELKRRGARGPKPCKAHRQDGFTAGCPGCVPAVVAVVGVGISADEIQRINARKSEPYESLAYPLVGLPAREDTGLRLRRDDCERLIAAEPLPPDMAAPLKEALDLLPPVTRHDLLQFDFTRMPRPPKSACYFCPFHRPETWHNQRRDEPELFGKSCDLEDLLNARRDELGKDHVFLTRFAQPLRVAIPDGVDLLPIFDGDDANCDNGWCMT